MQHKDTKAMVEGAVFTAITALMGIIITYIPILSIMSYIWPVPIIIVGYRNGLRISILSTIIASIIISMFTTLANGSFLLVTLGLPGIVMGYMLNKRIKVNIVVVVTALVLSITLTLSVVGSIYIFSPAVMEKISSFEDAFNELSNQVESIYEIIGSDQETIQQTLDNLNNIYDIFKVAFPILIITSNIPLAYMIFKLTRLILNRLGYHIDDTAKFTEMRLPHNMGIGALVLMSLIFLVNFSDIYWLKIIATNANILMSFVFMITGISVVAYYVKLISDKYSIPWAVRYFLGIAAALIFMTFLPIIGILDTALDIRKWASAFREV